MLQKWGNLERHTIQICYILFLYLTPHVYVAVVLEVASNDESVEPLRMIKIDMIESFRVKKKSKKKNRLKIARENPAATVNKLQ